MPSFRRFLRKLLACCEPQSQPTTTTHDLPPARPIVEEPSIRELPAHPPCTRPLPRRPLPGAWMEPQRQSVEASPSPSPPSRSPSPSPASIPLPKKPKSKFAIAFSESDGESSLEEPTPRQPLNTFQRDFHLSMIKMRTERAAAAEAAKNPPKPRKQLRFAEEPMVLTITPRGSTRSDNPPMANVPDTYETLPFHSDAEAAKYAADLHADCLLDYSIKGVRTASGKINHFPPRRCR
ncbi:MAG: hypothetical protein Q9174_004682 [Haloplaca sp. 1 TL-2023]